jgi:transposase-like protein
MVIDYSLYCPRCDYLNFLKNGRIHNKKPKYKCQECGRQFVERYQNKFISDETKKMINNLLLEKISLAGIARATGVSEKWLQNYVNSKYDKVYKKIKVSTKNSGKLLIECDEGWFYVGNKNNK